MDWYGMSPNEVVHVMVYCLFNVAAQLAPHVQGELLDECVA
jgi:hypothetical protein